MSLVLTWEVFVPGQDLPVELQTDYIPGPGEEITLDGVPWTVETVEQNPEDSDEVGNGRIYVIAPKEPAA